MGIDSFNWIDLHLLYLLGKFSQMKHVLAENDKSHFAVSRKSRLKFENSQTDFVVKYSILLKNIFHSNDVSDLVLVL